MSDTIRTQFKKILESKKRGELDSLLHDTSFRQLPEKERQYLATMAIEHGIAALNRSCATKRSDVHYAAKGGDCAKLKSTVEKEAARHSVPPDQEETRPYFELATKLCPLSSDIYLLQAKAYFEQGVKKNHNAFFARALQLASKARRCDKESLAAHFVTAEILLQLMQKTHRPSYLSQFLKNQERLETLALDRDKRAQLSELWGHYWKESFYHSEEPSDIEKAQKWYQKAISFGQRKYLHLELAKLWVTLCAKTTQASALVRARSHLSLFKQFEKPTCDQLKEVFFLEISIYEKIGGSPVAIMALAERIQKTERPLNFDGLFHYGCFLADVAWDLRSDYYYSCLKTLYEESLQKEAERLSEDKSSSLLPLILIQSELLCLEGVLFEKASSLQQARALLVSHVDDPKQLLSIKESRFWQTKGRIELELGRFFDCEKELFEAQQSIQKALLIDSGSARVWHLFAKTYFCTGEIKDEATSVQKSVALFNQARCLGEYSPYFWHDWALSLLKLSEWDGDFQSVEDAIACFEKSIEMQRELRMSIDPDMLYLYGSAWDYLAEITDNPQGSEKAISILEEVVAIDPEHNDARYNLALSYLHKGQNSDDLTAIEKACRLFCELVHADHEDDYLWNELAVAMLHRAVLWKKSGERPLQVQSDFDEAKKALQRAIALKCDHGFYNLACAHALTGMTEEAFDALEKAIQCKVHPSASEVEEDEWLDSIRDKARFNELVSKIKETESARQLLDADQQSESEKSSGETKSDFQHLDDLLDDYSSDEDELFDQS